MKHQLYKITNIKNGKHYIGIHTGNIFKDNYWGSGSLLKKAIEKYGIDIFQREVLNEFNNRKEAYDKEAEIVNEEFIKSKDTYNTAIGGNGGNLGILVNKKISDSMLGEKHMYYGKKRPNHSKWLKENSPMRGKSHKEESLIKMRNNHPATKIVLQFTKDGEFIKEWQSANQAVKETGIGHIHKVAEGIRKTAGGYIWKYKK